MTIKRANGGGLGGSGSPGGALGSFYSHTIDQSLRFEEAGSSYLTFTPSSNGTDNKRYTFSVWIKLAQGSGDFRTVFSSKNTGSGTGQGHNTYAFDTGDDFAVFTQNGGANPTSPRLYRDPNSWYHFLVAYDTTQSTDTDRVKVYVNGTQQTDYTGTFPGLNSVMASVNTNGQEQRWGRYVSAYTRYFNGYMAEIHMVDGQALDPTSFGETKDGVWVPKQYADNGTTSHGVNGYHLDFADNTAIGNDVSGNNNDFTASGLNAHDVVPDSPTKNFAVMNPLTIGDGRVASGVTQSEGNLKVACAGFSTSILGGTYSTIAIPKDKKIYVEVCEINQDANLWGAGVVIDNHVQNSTQLSGNGSISYYNRSVFLNGTETDYGSSAGAGGLGVAKLTAGDVLGIAVDGATGKVWFHRNGTYFKSPSTNNSGTTGNPSAGSNEIGTITNTTAINPSGEIFIFVTGNTSVDDLFVNFGQDSTFAGNKSAGSETDSNGDGKFLYAVPTDYVCLHSGNMSDITIGPGQTSQADDYFNSVLYTGNGNTGQNVTGVGFQPEFLWLKNRNQGGGYQHILTDIVRGAGIALRSSETAAESDRSAILTAFISDGFTLASGQGDTWENNSSGLYVAWNWKAGGSASTISVGSVSSGVPSIASSVSANQDAGFSIVSWVGTGANATIGHGLSEDPQLILVKNRDDSADWPVYNETIGAANRLYLNLTNDSSGASTLWNSTAATNQVFSVGSSNLSNGSSDDMIAYCFHSVEGYSKVGSFVGNGSADGTFVYTGFRPAWVMYKQSSTAGGWNILDNKRQTFNDATGLPRLFADTSGVESDTDTMQGQADFVSSGFKLRSNNSSGNSSGATLIYLAFAEAPFKFSNAR